MRFLLIKILTIPISDTALSVRHCSTERNGVGGGHFYSLLPGMWATRISSSRQCCRGRNHAAQSLPVSYCLSICRATLYR
jgi:hypothetical protein